MKTCSKCKVEKAVDEFTKDRRRRDGLNPQCRACCQAYQRANKERIAAQQRDYREANKEKISERDRRRYQANRGVVAEKRRQYREANKEKVAEQQRRYRDANLDRLKRQKRAYYEANKGEIIGKAQRYYEANKAEINEKQRIRYESNPDIAWAYTYSAAARRAGLEPVVEEFTKADVIRLYGDACVYCDGGAFEHLDHYVPVSQGGPHTLENVRPSCAFCNMSKSNHSPEEWEQRKGGVSTL